MSIRIHEEALVLERETVRRLLRDRGVPSFLCEIDQGDYGFTRAHLDLLEALEAALAVSWEASKHAVNLLAAHGGQADALVRLFGLYSGGVAALQSTPEPIDVKVRVNGAFTTDHLEPLLAAPLEGLSAALLDDWLSWLRFHRCHQNPEKRVERLEGAISCTRAYFELLVNAARQQGEDACHGLLLDALRGTRIEITQDRPKRCWTMQGFSWSPSAVQEESGLVDVWPDDVVGNEDFMRAGLRLARDVAGFDMETRSNPKRLNPVMFAMGDPGCGKTVTCHAIGNYFLKFCRERGIPARFVVIRRTDWASSYQNASAQQLLDIFKQRVAGFDGVCGVYWPDIDTAFAARSDGGLRSEEKNILGASFGIFDGTVIPKNGQWFMLCDANTLNMDQATISRITQDPFHLKGPVTAQDFAVLMRDKKLRNHAAFLQLTDEEWLRAGQKCIDAKLSGRAVDNFTRKIISEIEDFEYPDEYYKADLARRREIIAECSKPMAFARVMEIIEHYQRFEREAEARASQERFEERVREIVLNMTAHAAASTLGGGQGATRASNPMGGNDGTR